MGPELVGKTDLNRMALGMCMEGLLGPASRAETFSDQAFGELFVGFAALPRAFAGAPATGQFGGQPGGEVVRPQRPAAWKVQRLRAVLVALRLETVGEFLERFTIGVLQAMLAQKTIRAQPGGAEAGPQISGELLQE